MALKLFQLLEKHNKRVFHDHLAFRTVSYERCNTLYLSRELEALGFYPAESYQCSPRHLTLTSFHHPGHDYPGILISELDLQGLNEQTQNMIMDLIYKSDQQSILGTRPWPLPSIASYQHFMKENPFLAWFSLFGLASSYWSVDINQLDRQNDMSKLIKLIVEEGYPLDNNDGLVKGSPERLMEQIITLQDQVEFTFADGQQLKTASGNYRFSLRYKTPAGKLYKGLYPLL